MVQEKEHRLCSRRYQLKDAQQRTALTSGNRGNRVIQNEFAGRFVFSYDAEDIKAHKWFRGIPWDRLHQLDPPFVPMIRAPDDTQYFDEEELITEFSDSEDEDDDLAVVPPDMPPSSTTLKTATGRDGADDPGPDCTSPRVGKSDPSSTSTVNHVQQVTPPPSERPSPIRICKDDMQGALSSEAVTLNAISTNPSKKRGGREAHLAEILRPFVPSIQHAVRSWLTVPYDSLRLRNFELQVDLEPGLRSSQRDALKALVRVYGRKEKKRPRDRLLRDPLTKKIVLEERKKTAFLGYDWRRGQPPPLAATLMQTSPSRSVSVGQVSASSRPADLSISATMGDGFVLRPEEMSQGGGGWLYLPSGHEHLATLRAIHRGRLSMN